MFTGFGVIFPNPNESFWTHSCQWPCCASDVIGVYLKQSPSEGKMSSVESCSPPLAHTELSKGSFNRWVGSSADETSLWLRRRESENRHGPAVWRNEIHLPPPSSTPRTHTHTHSLTHTHTYPPPSIYPTPWSPTLSLIEYSSDSIDFCFLVTTESPIQLHNHPIRPIRPKLMLWTLGLSCHHLTPPFGQHHKGHQLLGRSPFPALLGERSKTVLVM